MSIYWEDYVVELLRNTHERKTKLSILQFELANPQKVTKGEIIDAMNFARNEGVGGYNKGHISDKTMQIALHYQDQADKLNISNIEDIAKEYMNVKQELERLDFYISQLKHRQSEIIRMTYVDGHSQEVIAQTLHIAVRTVQNDLSKAIAALAKMYEYTESLR